MNDHSVGLDETLQTIVEVARDSVPGFDHAGISILLGNRRAETRAATGDLVLTLDQAQYDLGEGPCVATLRDQAVVWAPDIQHDQRWPRYARLAAQAGLRAQLAVKLSLDGEGTLGVLNYYSTRSGAVHPEVQPVAELFATQAALALSSARERAMLTEALQSRRVIGEAIGILMERHQLNEDRAVAFLARTSSQGKVTVRDIAQELVDKRNAQHPDTSDGVQPAAAPSGSHWQNDDT